MPDHALLTADDHRELRIATSASAACGDGVMYAIAVPTEFRRLQAEYPILFRPNAQRDGWFACALFGFEDGENLFLRDGTWDAGYRPLATDIQPFLIGGGPADTGDKQVHVDLASPRITTGGEGVRVFDADGRPTPYLEAIAGKLGELDEGYRLSGDFFTALLRHELIEPTTLEITLNDGSVNRLVGFHAIAEERLQALDGAALAELHAAGHLMPVFMALASLGQFAELIARKNRKLAGG